MLFAYRDGSKVCPAEIAAPQGTVEESIESRYTPFNYYLDEGSGDIVFFNYREITSGSNSVFQVLYKNIKIMDTTDESRWELKPGISVQTDDGVESGTATALTGRVDSQVNLTKVTKRAYNYSGTSYTPGL